jgi:hypothetical protein
MQTLQGRPWFLVALLAPIPLLTTLLGMLGGLGGEMFAGLLIRPESVLNGAPNPWPAILGPLIASSTLLGLFAWLTVALPVSPLLRTRSLRLKRAVVAVGALLTAATFWLGILLGDILWHAALSALPDAGTPSSYESAPWLILLAVLLSSGLCYRWVRPSGHKRRRAP